MIRTNKLKLYQWAFAIFVFGMLLDSCSNGTRNLRVHISEPKLTGQNNDSERIVSVLISSEDLRRFANEEIYTRIVVTECGDEKQRYPTETYIGQVSLDNFQALKAVAQQTTPHGVELQGSVLVSFLSRLTEPCLMLDGGSYSGLSITSNVLKINSKPN